MKTVKNSKIFNPQKWVKQQVEGHSHILRMLMLQSVEIAQTLVNSKIFCSRKVIQHWL